MAEAEDRARELIKAAAEVVEVAGIPDDLRRTGFQFVLKELSKSWTEPGSNPGSGGRSMPASSITTGVDWAAEVARHIGADGPQDIVDALYWDGDQLEITLARNVFDDTKAEAQREVALLVIAALEVLGDNEWVSIVDVRDVCQDLGIYDRNLAANLRALGAQLRTRGSGNNLRFRLSEPGRRTALELFDRLTAPS